MLSRVILAIACTVGLCAAQSESSPAAPDRSASSTAAKEVVAQSAPGAASNTGTPPEKSAAPPIEAKPASGPEAPSASKTPNIDAPPARKTPAPAIADKTPGAAPKAGTNGQALAPKPEAAPYVIGPLDVLIIKVWGQSNLSGPVDVGADGNISLPLVNDVKADGLTKEQLKAELTKRLSEFLNGPEVDVQIGKINSKSYFVYGGVGRAGEYPLIKPTTIMDAMSAVGGFRDFANTKKIRIQRKLPSGEIQELKFNYKDVSKGKNMEQNIYLQNGDRIFVPE
jgi:polysaccharide export outer membrane protein